MKNVIKNLLLTVVMFAVVSCGDKGDDFAKTIEELKSVAYETEAPKVITSKKTNNEPVLTFCKQTRNLDFCGVKHKNPRPCL